MQHATHLQHFIRFTRAVNDLLFVGQKNNPLAAHNYVISRSQRMLQSQLAPVVFYR